MKTKTIFVVGNHWDQMECSDAAALTIQWLAYRLAPANSTSIKDGSDQALYARTADDGTRIVYTGSDGILAMSKELVRCEREYAMIEIRRLPPEDDVTGTMDLTMDQKNMPSNYHIVTVEGPKVNRFELFHQLEKVWACYHVKPPRPKTDRFTA